MTRILFSLPRQLFRTLGKSGRLFLTLTIALAAPAVCKGKNRIHPKRAVRALVENRIDPDGPGAAILVSQNGVPLHMAGYGLADLKARWPISAHSLFDLDTSDLAEEILALFTGE